MVKNTNGNELTVKRLFKFILKAFLVLIGLFILYVIGLFATSPLFDKFDHDRFIALDTQMQGVYQKLKAASSGDDWKYEKVCSADRSGWMTTGEYDCVLSISLKGTVGSIVDVNSLHSKYYSIIQKTGVLSHATGSDIGTKEILGNTFTTGSVYEDYNEKKSGIRCRYLVDLGQDSDNSYRVSSGLAIKNEVGVLLISLRCEGMARSSWYPLVASTSSIIP